MPEPQLITGKLTVGRAVVHVNGTSPFTAMRGAPARPSAKDPDAGTWVVLDAHGQNCASIRLDGNNVVDAATPTELRAVFDDPATARQIAHHLNDVANNPRPL